MTVTDSRPATSTPQRSPQPPRRRKASPRRRRPSVGATLRVTALSIVTAIRARRDVVLAALTAATIGFLVGTSTANSPEPPVAAAPASPSYSSPSYSPPSYSPPSYGSPSYSSPSYSPPSYGSSYGGSSSGYGSGTTSTSGPVSPESIGESTYLVGKGDGELPPGTYVGKCTGSLSSWTRYGDGGTDDLVDYDSIYTSGQLVVTVKGSDSSVKFTGSCSWSKR